MDDRVQQLNLRSRRPDDLLEDEGHHRSTGLWVSVVVLGGALIGAAVYGYPILEKHADLLGQLPGLKESLIAATKRVDAVEEKLQGWVGDWATLEERTSALETKVGRNLEVAKKQTQQLAAEIHQRIVPDLEKRNASLQASVNRLESEQQSARSRVEQLESELAAARRESSQEIARLRQEREKDTAGTEVRLARVDRQLETRKRELDDFAGQFERRRIDFEAAVNHQREVAPGVSLNVRNTDISHQRFDGWIWLMPDRRTVWVRGRGLQQPLVFYSGRDTRPREVVITRVTKYSVVGFVTVPAEPRGMARAPLAAGSPAPFGPASTGPGLN